MCQFDHSTSDKLKRLLKSAKIEDKELLVLRILSSVQDKCKVQSPLGPIVQQDNVVLGKMINKLMLDRSVNYSFDIIVPWGVSAKNALLSCYGYSPNQLVFEKPIFSI